jgi:DNA-binding GntR family transcriptional regulator
MAKLVQPVTKGEAAKEALRSMILSGELEPGARLRLRDLADQLGLSIMPVRDALRALETEGLVVSSEHRGARVSQTSPEEILELASLRMWIEVHAIRIATPRQDEKTLARAQKALDGQSAAVRAGNGPRFTEHNRRFHEAIEEPAGPLITGLIGDLWNRLWQARRSSALYVIDADRMPAALRDHTAIFEAVAAGDGEKAAKLFEAHRISSLKGWRRALEAHVDEEASNVS